MTEELIAKWAGGMADILSREEDQTAEIERFLEDLGLKERGAECGGLTAYLWE